MVAAGLKVNVAALHGQIMAAPAEPGLNPFRADFSAAQRALKASR
jgi:hypothetical protein